MKTTPDNITVLVPGQIFVYGSNLAGIHGRGAAFTASHKFGALRGQGRGLAGQSYGIPTKGYRLETLKLSEISRYVDEFLKFATAHPELEFLVTKIGTNLAGYSVQKVKQACFDGKVIPPNVALPIEFQPSRHALQS